MSTLITNATLITRDAQDTVIPDGGGALAFEGALITDVGSAAELEARYPEAERIDARGRLVMPGLINTHMHYYSTFARGIDFGSRPATTFGEVLSGLWWRLDKMLTLEDVYYSAVGPMIDCVRNGVTTVIDHHASPSSVRDSLLVIAKAAQRIGIRSNLCYEVSDRDGEEVAKAGIAENAAFVRSCQQANDDMLRGLMGVHAQMTISQPTMDALVAEAESLGVGYHIHAAEGIEDVVNSLGTYGRRVIERLSDNGILNERSIVVHCVQVLDEEIELLAHSGVAVINNPESNMSNAVGASPVLKMLAAGVLVGMGTDGYCTDMTESLRGVHALVKHEARIPSVGWAEPPRMLFENNRTIINRLLVNGHTGVLEPGAYADLIIVDYEAPTPVSAKTINSHILFGVMGRSVATTIINGRIVMRERELVDIDEEKIMAVSREQAARLWSRI
ncbi:MAG: putative aminohydrolase SsnA [Coriobacteriales bacterium]|jgi:putative selenium metabolism protein SsnA|nr:putative aminohydrolase SsnA [Coriobacteriales bacterium]